MKLLSKKGFSLLELILVLGIGATIAFLKFQDMKVDQENLLAQGVGQQMKQMGEAVNRYVSIRYDKIALLSSATGNGTDPGPRTCTAAGCEITYQTLINEGLLPSTYTGYNVNKSAYKIYLKRDGTSPNYVINGLITTSSAWLEKTNIRYDLLGKAMQEAGIDSGMSKSSTSATGYNGQWSETKTDFPNITVAGQFAYRVGYNAALYSVYLRRDGTLPMTGNLNMGANDLYNAKNITASGKGTFGDDLSSAGDISSVGSITSGSYIKSAGDITAGGQVIAHNGYGDALTIGGDNVADDFDVKLSGKTYLGFLSADKVPITIGINGKLLVRPSSADSSNGNRITLDSSDGSIVTTGRIATNNLSPTDIPTNFSAGGVRTVDVVATGSLYSILTGTAASENKYAFYARQDGNVKASGNLTVGGSIESAGYNKADNFQPTSTATVGGTCSYSGAISRDSAGFTLSCQSGKWQRQFNPTVTMRDDGVWAANSDYQACNSDEVIVGGGGQCEDPAHHFIHYSGPSGNGWSIDCFYTSPEYKDLGSRVYALCMKK